jgi:hypothetical protein
MNEAQREVMEREVRRLQALEGAAWAELHTWLDRLEREVERARVELREDGAIGGQQVASAGVQVREAAVRHNAWVAARRQAERLARSLMVRDESWVEDDQLADARGRPEVERR